MPMLSWSLVWIWFDVLAPTGISFFWDMFEKSSLPCRCALSPTWSWKLSTLRLFWSTPCDWENGDGERETVDPAGNALKLPLALLILKFEFDWVTNCDGIELLFCEVLLGVYSMASADPKSSTFILALISRPICDEVLDGCGGWFGEGVLSPTTWM